MRRHSRNQLLKVLLGTGLYVLLKGRERRADTIRDNIRGRFERPSHLKWILVGVGVGVGVGMVLAPVTGRETRERISDKVHDIGGRVRGRFQAEGARATGT
jgi:uncharacterized membrane protein YidH (DUF202 family)